jgi:hypothetical protein
VRPIADDYCTGAGVAKGFWNYIFDISQTWSGDFSQIIVPYMDGAESKWSDFEYSVEQAFELVGITNTCEKEGEFNSRPCGKKDYVSTEDYSSTPSAPVNPWEREWRSTETEIMAKTVWCIANGYSDYNKATDGCR